MKIGYARTSTIEQVAGFEAQIRDLKAHGCEKLFQEQLSSVDSKRAQLEAAIDYCRDGDVLICTKLDRLARSVSDLVKIEERLKAKGANLHVMDPAMDTGTPVGRLVFNVIASIAQFEREVMLSRQREGIAKAKRDGKYKGRKPTARSQAEQIRALSASKMRATDRGSAQDKRALCLQGARNVSRCSASRLLVSVMYRLPCAEGADRVA